MSDENNEPTFDELMAEIKNRAERDEFEFYRFDIGNVPTFYNAPLNVIFQGNYWQALLDVNDYLIKNTKCDYEPYHLQFLYNIYGDLVLSDNNDLHSMMDHLERDCHIEKVILYEADDSDGESSDAEPTDIQAEKRKINASMEYFAAIVDGKEETLTKLLTDESLRALLHEFDNTALRLALTRSKNTTVCKHILEFINETLDAHFFTYCLILAMRACCFANIETAMYFIKQHPKLVPSVSITDQLSKLVESHVITDEEKDNLIKFFEN